MLNMANSIRHNARLRPDALALEMGDITLSYRVLDRLVSGCARALQLAGLAQYDRVIIVLENSIDWVVAYQGVMRAGCIPVPVNPLLSPAEIEHIISDCEPMAIIATRHYLHAPSCLFYNLNNGAQEILFQEADVLPCQPCKPDDTAVILYSSGSTGQPKGVELTHANLLWNAQAFALDLLRLTPCDRGMAVLPSSHVFGHTCMLTAFLLTGASILIVPRFDAEDVLRLIAEKRVTIFMGVPTMYWTMARAEVDANLDLSHWRLCVSGGQSLPHEVHTRFENRFGVQISEGYGMTEASPSVCGERLFGEPRKPGSAGQPYWGVELRIIGDKGQEVPNGTRGEIQIRSPGVAARYFRKPELTEQTFKDGWLCSGDIGYVDEDGFLFVVDRMKEIIISGGYNVYPREIEEVGHKISGILEVAAIGLPDERLGEKIIAYVVPDKGVTLDLGELQKIWSETLARYKVPREIRLLTALPRNATGKIDRMCLRKMSLENGEINESS